jgi:hypothetical protein
MARTRQAFVDASSLQSTGISPPSGEDWESRVARRAYELWQARGCPHGDDLRDWFEAELQLAGAVTAGGTRR